MAVAACFGGPVLNLLVCTGAPVLGASFKHGVLPFRLSPGITALFLETVRRWQGVWRLGLGFARHTSHQTCARATAAFTPPSRQSLPGLPGI